MEGNSKYLRDGTFPDGSTKAEKGNNLYNKHGATPADESKGTSISYLVEHDLYNLLVYRGVYKFYLCYPK